MAPHASRWRTDAEICSRFMQENEKVEVKYRRRGSCLHALLFEVALFAEDATAHLEDGFESFAANLGIFTESFHACFFDLVLNLLPPTTKSSNLCFLVEFSCGGRVEGALPVDNGFADAEDIWPCQVGGAHGDFLRNRIDIGDFVNVGGIRSSKNRENPLWYRLVASDKTLSAQLKGTSQ